MKTNKFTFLKHLSIGIGLTLSFGNTIINVSPSFANDCATVNGQTICSTSSNQNRIPSQSQAQVYCSDYITKNCVNKREGRSGNSNSSSNPALDRQIRAIQGRPTVPLNPTNPPKK